MRGFLPGGVDWLLSVVGSIDDDSFSDSMDAAFWVFGSFALDK